MISAIYVLVFTLALVGSPAWAGGWYLMLPPVAQDDRERPYFDDGAPLGEWQHIGAYDSAAQCEEVKLNQKVGVKGQMVNVPNANGYKRCIATDDPRLTVDPRGPKGKWGLRGIVWVGAIRSAIESEVLGELPESPRDARTYGGASKNPRPGAPHQEAFPESTILGVRCRARQRATSRRRH